MLTVHGMLRCSCAPMAYVIWKETMKLNPKNPQFFNRDRFVLSAGHGSMLQYSLLYLAGFDSVTVSRLCPRHSSGWCLWPCRSGVAAA